MKEKSKWLVYNAFFIILISCMDREKTPNDIIHLNVNGVYPEKSITLEEIADVRYVQLEVDDEYLFEEKKCTIDNSLSIVHFHSCIKLSIVNF